ncbi:hypothetical protein FRC02_003631 [Tulasnella sp. 418]|nr:hypothetical protein FRC02_003631 [Tulasnella sp. 418]
MEPPRKIRRLDQAVKLLQPTQVNPSATLADEITSSKQEKQSTVTKDYTSSTSNSIRSARACLREFMGMRGKDIPIEHDSTPLESVQEAPSHSAHEVSRAEKRSIPEEILPYVAFCLPNEPVNIPSYSTKFITSFDLMQKRGIFQYLFDPNTCGIEIIERTSLEDVDVILSADAAAIFCVLPGLPVDHPSLAEKICRNSWRFSRLLIIFEAYSPSRSKRVQADRDSIRHIDDDALSINCFSAPVLKAFRQLRRSLVISESANANSKNAACVVEFVFALNEREAALYARVFGDRLAQQEQDWRSRNASQQVNSGVYGASMLLDRSWLVDDEYEGERELAAFDGMNIFAAAAMLSQVNIQSLVDEMTPQERVEYFAEMVGLNRVVQRNYRSSNACLVVI